MKVLSWRIASVTSLLLAAAGVTHAEQVSGTFVAPVFKFGNNDIQNDSVVENADGSFTMSGTDGSQAAGWLLGWNINVDYDPFINGSVTLTNFSSSAHNYTLFLDLPVGAFGPTSVFGGSLTATVFDDNGDSFASLGRSDAANASPGIYQGTIDGTGVLDLFGAISCSGSGPHCSATLTDDNGLPGPTIPGPAVNGHIGTILKFNLSAGDRVVLNTNFTVEPSPVPLPASAWMLIAALGCMSYLFVTRRRAGDALPAAPI
ncbi:MAG: VPLPA-CTERM sorting domain-containing protein [Gammaproteobacteria bacterium]